MTRKELQIALDKYPENMDVFIPSYGEFDFEPVETTHSQIIRFHSGEEDEQPAEVECIVLYE